MNHSRASATGHRGAHGGVGGRGLLAGQVVRGAACATVKVRGRGWEGQACASWCSGAGGGGLRGGVGGCRQGCNRECRRGAACAAVKVAGAGRGRQVHKVAVVVVVVVGCSGTTRAQQGTGGQPTRHWQLRSTHANALYHKPLCHSLCQQLYMHTWGEGAVPVTHGSGGDEQVTCCTPNPLDSCCPAGRQVARSGSACCAARFPVVLNLGIDENYVHV